MRSRLERRHHPDDGSLLRFLDGDAAAVELARVATHLERCARCTGTIEELRASSAILSDALARASVPPIVLPPLPKVVRHRRAPSSAGRAWRVAAGLLLVAAGAALASPVVRNAAREWWATIADPAIVTHPPASSPQPEERTVLAVVPGSPTVVLQFAAAQQDGALIVEAHNGATLMLRTTHAGRVGVTMLPTHIRVQNAHVANASFRLRVPSTVREVRIVVGDEVALAMQVRELVAGGAQRIRL